jgi:hypothetical protein
MANRDHVVSDYRQVRRDASIRNRSAGFEHRTNHRKIQFLVEPYLIQRIQAFAITRQHGYALWPQAVNRPAARSKARPTDDDVAVRYYGPIPPHKKPAP